MWAVITGIFLSIGAFIIKIGDKLVATRNVPKDMREWYPELERAYLAIVNKNRELLEVVHEASELRKELPPEYQAILDQVLNMARLVENASFEQAAQDGVVPRYWFGGPQREAPMLQPLPPDKLPVPAPPPDADPAPVTVATYSSASASGPTRATSGSRNATTVSRSCSTASSCGRARWRSATRR